MEEGVGFGLGKLFVQGFDGFGRANVIASAACEKYGIVHSVRVADGVGKTECVPCGFFAAFCHCIAETGMDHAVCSAECRQRIVGEEGFVGTNACGSASCEDRAHQQSSTAALTGSVEADTVIENLIALPCPLDCADYIEKPFAVAALCIGAYGVGKNGPVSVFFQRFVQ